MSGKWTTSQQARLYMNARNDGCTQKVAAAKSGVSERTGQRLDSGYLDPGKPRVRHWKTRKDPFKDVWESEVVPKLKKCEKLSPTTLFEDLQDRHPGKYPNSCKRTFQRRVKSWKSLYGSGQEVMFRQSYPPGLMGLSDFSRVDGITVTIRGIPFAHQLYHFRLAYSGWSYVEVVQGGESYTALAEGLQNALWRLGGSPKEHRTDSLSAAYRNLSTDDVEDQTARYESFCEHYGMTPTRNNKGVSHENGSIESPHGHVKKRIRQGLLLRESADFDSVSEYQDWIHKTVQRLNRRCEEALAVEREQLQPLPKRKTQDFTEAAVFATSSSMISFRKVTYSVPSRLAGQHLRLHVFDDRIEVFLGCQKTLELPLIRAPKGQRARCIDYRHVIDSLVKKPQAFRYSQIRDDLLPTEQYRAIWLELNKQCEPRKATKLMVNILHLAAKSGLETAVGDYVQSSLAANHVPSIAQLEQVFLPRESVPDPSANKTVQHTLSSYDSLLEHGGCA